MPDTRGRSKRRAGETEKEIDEQEQEIELITDSEMEQQTDEIAETEIIMDKEKGVMEEDAQGDQIDKTGAREIPNWQELMNFMAEQNSCLLYTSRCV